MRPFDYIEEKLENIERQLTETKKELQAVDFIDKGYNFKLLLSDEKYRLQIAIMETSSNKDAAELLNVTERTIYRMRKRYAL